MRGPTSAFLVFLFICSVFAETQQTQNAPQGTSKQSGAVPPQKSNSAPAKQTDPIPTEKLDTDSSVSGSLPPPESGSLPPQKSTTPQKSGAAPAQQSGQNPSQSDLILTEKLTTSTQTSTSLPPQQSGSVTTQKDGSPPPQQSQQSQQPKTQSNSKPADQSTPLSLQSSLIAINGNKRARTIKDDHIKAKRYHTFALMHGSVPEGMVSDFSSPEIETEAYFGYPMTLDYVVDMYVESTDGTTSSYSVIADTGSSNLAIAVSDCTDCGSGSTSLDVDYYDPSMCVEVTYGSGSWKGYMTAETMVSMGSSDDQSGTDVYFSAITTGSSFFTSPGFDGILGLGYDGISSDYSTCSSSSDSIDATPYTDSLDTDSIIDENVFTMNFCGDVSNMAIGGVDSSQYSGDITYVDTQKTYGEDYGYFLVNIVSISIDDVDIGDVSTMNLIGGTLVDSGTTLLYVSTTVYTIIKSAVEDSLSTLSQSFFQWSSCISEDDLTSLPSLTFTIDDYDLELSASDYLLYYDDCYYWGISTSSVPIIGNIALQDLLVVFDKENNQVGFADAVCLFTEDKKSGQKKKSSNVPPAYLNELISSSSLLKSPVISIFLGVFGIVSLIIGFTYLRSIKRMQYQKIPVMADA